MIWVDIIITLIFIFSFIGGLKEGAVKGLFSLLSLIIAIPLTGRFYHWLTSIVTFIPDENWQNLVGFFGTFIIISIILALVFLIPSKLVQAVWNKGIIHALLGGFFGVLGFAISLVIFTTVMDTYPVFYWLEQVLINSSIISWLMTSLGFIKLLLPEIFRNGFTTVITTILYSVQFLNPK